MSRRLHVVVVPGWYPSAEDPVAGAFVREQALAAARHHDVTVVVDAARGAPARPRARERADGPLRELRVEGAGPPVGPLAPAVAARRLRTVLARLARDGRPADLLHAHVSTAGAAAVLAARGLPVVVTEHHTDYVEGKVRGRHAVAARWVFRRADLVTAVGPALRDAIATLEPRARLEVVPNAIDVDAFRPVRRAGGAGRLLTVGLLTAQKGVDHLIEALALLSDDRRPALTVVGDGPARGELERLAATRLGPGVVTFAGARDKTGVAAAMAEADAFVLASVAETFAVVAAEALACGLPILVTDAGGIADLVRELGGVVVAPRDAQALARGIERLLAVAPGFDGERAAAAVRERFSPAAVGARWDEIYRRLALA